MSATEAARLPALPLPGPARLIGGLSFAPSLVLAVLAHQRGELATSATLAVGAFVVLGWLALALVRRARRLVGPALALACLNLIAVVPELALRAEGFHDQARIEFGYPRPENFMVLSRHPKLHWTMRPDAPGINSLGFPGPEVGPKPAEGVFRILFLGDSCTFQGKSKEEGGLEASYAFETAKFLNAEFPSGVRYETVSTGVPGYTSHQGRLVAEMYGDAFEPDAVVVYYGWNDHWSAYGEPDHEKGSSSGLAQELYGRVRLLQLVSRLRTRSQGDASRPLDVQRVPVERYDENLRAIVRRFRSRGVPVVLVTAPESHRALGVPEYLVEQRFVPDEQAVLDLHRRYTDVVRAVAKEEGAVLLDLERELGELDPERIRQLFLSDGIHFTSEGIDVVAGRIADAIHELAGAPRAR